MTSSPEPARPLDALPPALSSMWRSLKLAHSAEPRLMSVAFGLSLLAAVPDALLALWLKLLADAVLEQQPRALMFAALGLGISTSATWLLNVLSSRIERRFRDRVTIALESHVASLQASVQTIEHHERPEYLDRLVMLRDQVFVLDHMYASLFSTCGWLLRLGITLVLLISIHPVLSLLALFALPTVITSAWRPGPERAAQERGAQHLRLGRHLFLTATTAPPGKEVRVTRIGSRLVEQRRAAFERWYGPVAAARRTSALWHAAAWGIFGLGYVAAVTWIALRPGANPGDVLLVLGAGSRLSAYIGAAVGEIGFLRGFWLEGSRRLAWLEDYAAAMAADADLSPPQALRDAIRFEHVSFRYPGTDRKVLDDVNLELKAGSARWWRSSVRTVRASPPWSSCCANSTNPPKGTSWSTAHRSRACRRSRGARGWPGPFRTSSASSFSPATPWAWAKCRAWKTRPQFATRSSAQARAMSCSSSSPASTRSWAPPGPRASM
jgi:ATP-binding cassette, subfamily B, bacterial